MALTQKMFLAAYYQKSGLCFQAGKTKALVNLVLQNYLP